LIVGTAGHIDHGKSALVRALTGTDPDRLKEEKERGITIDLGFAHAELGEGVVASFVDVPGHERFVRHMLAGAHGIDAVALVVASDESVMPQTREHFHICRLLGVPRGLVALTKCDLADPDSQALAELEVRELVAGSFLEGRPVVRVSARTGEGLPALREALLALARESPPRPTEGLLRLPVDRVFTMKGFGTVVTGTLVAGDLGLGDEVEALPSGRRARVRGLQVHGAAVERAVAGTRTAVNLAGDVEGLVRGEVLVRPSTLRPTSMIDAEISLLAPARPLGDGARVRVHAASAEVLARVRLLGTGSIEPGESGLAQLRLESPAVVGRGDRLVLRSYSPADTIGGAVVLDPLAPRRRAADRPAVERLRDATSPLAAAEALVAEAGPAGLPAPLLAARLTLPVARLAAEVGPSRSLVWLGQEPAVVLSRDALARLGAAALEALAVFHRAQPLKAGMPREELRARAFGRAGLPAFERVLADLAAAGSVKLSPDAVALLRHEVRLSPGEQEARALVLEAAGAAGLSGVETPALAGRAGRDAKLLERVGRVLVAERQLDRVGDGLLVRRDHLEALKARVRERWPPGSRIEVAAFKELTGLSRKYVIPLLEYLDREKVTRRSGNDRVAL
jgi:selenocysteine-specific elongation factor